MIELALIDKYNEMSNHTLQECRDICKPAYHCCRPLYCQWAKDFAKETRGIDLDLLITDDFKKGLTDLPFMNLRLSNGLSTTGCVVSPWLRPSCTIHSCMLRNVGKRITCIENMKEDREWQDKYNHLYSEIVKLEYEYHLAKKEDLIRKEAQ